MHKKLFFLVIPAAALLLLASCGSKKPDYLIGAGRDNGFVPAYRAYFSIQGDKIKKISVLKYERLTLGKESEYDFIRESTYHFYDINADTDDPADWTYTQNEYEKELYDVDKLKADLKTIGVPFKGKIYIYITTFDEYRIYEIENVDDTGTHLGQKCAVFRNDELLDIPKNMDLSSLRDFYKKR